MLGDKRGPIFGREKETTFEKELNEWERMIGNYTGNAHESILYLEFEDHFINKKIFEDI